MSFLSLSSELAGTLPGLSPVLCDSYINRAWQEIRNARLWAFLTDETEAVFPTILTTGTVSVVQYNSVVTLNSVASVALASLLSALNGVVALTDLQFRVSTGGLGGGQLYLCQVFDSVANTLTLDRVVQEPTGTNVQYQIYRAYIQAPSDFVRWESFDDFSNGFAITGDRLTRSRVEFDRRDPQRQSQGLAYFVGYLKKGQSSTCCNAATQALYELWPHPTNGQAFVVSYKQQGQAFSDPDDTQPPIVPDSLIVDRALGWHGYPWVQANRGGFPQYAKTDMIQLIKACRDGYFRQLMDVKRQDDENGLQSVYSRGRGRGGPSGLLGPADARYWQSHPISW